MRVIREGIIDKLSESEAVASSVGPDFDPVRGKWKD